MTTTAGPAQSADLLSPDEAGEQYRKSASRLRRHLNSGALHGHRPRDVPNARWDIPRACLLAWLTGQDPGAQQRACPLCAAAPVTSTRGRRRP